MTADKKESKFVSVVVYLHNSGRNIESFLTRYWRCSRRISKNMKLSV